ncbi:VTT domain-containing protein [Nocardioides sp. ChNu-153]|uniref:VTT domain-containing protein n=1 Tax=unclassified Nocardioides TaxID=2615069 RepID=UPI002405119C|nr:MULTISPECIES: VTT domain-containing protein [unclassified Nocardioides]MDF9717045.1 VTT domain-containing protein [Nocardioides sp. ChNu-99]MDN7122243.1 VTT domain-containing protein [Nocardioides sp. ChNu-153]
MILLLTTFGVGVASALLPVVNAEAYLAGVGALGTGGLVLLSVAAGAGQTLGKVVWYEVARRGVETEWARKKLSGPKVQRVHQRWSDRMEGRPWYAAAIMLVSSLGGVPPLLVMAAVAGVLRMRREVFVVSVLVGRSLRFWLVLAGVHLLFH